MIDSALKDTADDDDRLINFDKCRKEFELLMQIRLLQAAAALYHIEPDADFWQKFYSIPVTSDSERYCFLISYVSISIFVPSTKKCYLQFMPICETDWIGFFAILYFFYFCK